MFGREVPKEIMDKLGEPVRYWGARAIFKPYSDYPIDIVPDRVDVRCEDGRKIDPLHEWLNKVGIPTLKKMKDFLYLGANSNEVVEVKDGQFTLQVSPNSSYGYLYMGAWQYYPEGCEYEMVICPDWVQYNKDEETTQIKWSGEMPPPAIGSWIKCNFNGGLWYGHVTAYFVEHGYLGIEVDCHRRPAYHRKQNPYRRRVLFFGCDITEVKKPKTT